MAYVVAALAGVVGLGLGWIVAAFAALAIGALIGVSDFEGQRAMVAFFAIGPIGGLIGLILGVWTSRKLKIGRRPTLLTLLIAVALVILAVHRILRLQNMIAVSS